MTGKQKQEIEKFRLQGLGYSRIAEELGLSVNTIKSFCRRNNLACNASKDTGNNDDKDSKEICKQCGKKLEQKEKSKPKSFCNDKCRFEWWNAHRNKLKHNKVYNITCACCKLNFESHGNKKRKYCSHACYIKARFGEGVRHDKGAI